MARIRSIKPEFWSHPVLAQMPDEVRLAAIGLLNFSDDQGYFLATAAAVRSALWPFDEDSSKARRILQELSRVGYIEVRDHGEQGPVGRVVNFAKHQRVDKPSPSKLKGYFDSANVRGILAERSATEQGAGSREQGAGNGSGKVESPVGDSPRDAAPAARTMNGNRSSVIELPDWLLPEVWSDWDEYRSSAEFKRTHKAPWTEKAQKLAIAKLERFRANGHDPRDVVDLAIESGWRGLYEPKGAPQSRQPEPEQQSFLGSYPRKRP